MIRTSLSIASQLYVPPYANLHITVEMAVEMASATRRLEPASFALPILPSEFSDTRGREQSRIRVVRLNSRRREAVTLKATRRPVGRPSCS